MQAHVEDAPLVARAVAGDTAARRALAGRLSPVIRARIARRLGRAGTPDVVDDLAQQLWSRLFEAGSFLSRWAPGGLSVENFIGRAAEWEALHYLRDRGLPEEPIERASEVPSELDLEHHVSERDRARKLYAAVSAQLPAKGRLVMAALYVDELSPDEAADALGVSRQVIYNWQYKIRSLARAASER